ncbi:hypothetical protein AAVH_08330 [Aphelenchoides avenae]|nr:hypothetical protein AAVH_08330 [Aphelenchus avenae]
MDYKGYELSATVTKSDSAKVIAIAYKGTSTNVGQFVGELGSAAWYAAFGGNQFGLDPTAKILGYFHDAFEEVWIGKEEAMGKAVVQMVNEHPDYEVWVSGKVSAGRT